MAKAPSGPSRTPTSVSAGGPAGQPSKADRSAPVPPAGDAPRREVQVDFEAPAPAPDLATSPVRRIVGQPLTSRPAIASDEPAPDTLRELAYLDRINEIGPADQSTAPAPCRGSTTRTTPSLPCWIAPVWSQPP